MYQRSIIEKETISFGKHKGVAKAIREVTYKTTLECLFWNDKITQSLYLSHQ